jgi:ferredoxin
MKARRVEGKKVRSLKMSPKASIPCFPANSCELSDVRNFDAPAASTVQLKKPSVGPKGLMGPPCHGVCALACPVQAIVLEPDLKIEKDKCLECGLCFHICPVGVYSENNKTDVLPGLVKQVKGIKILELACFDFKRTETGPSGCDMVLHAGGCLAAIGPSIYIDLFASGVKEIRVRLDECDTCRKGKVKKEIEGIISQVCAILSLDREPDYRVDLIEQREEGWEIRQLVNIDQQKVTRRDFLHCFISSSGPGAEANRPPQERIRFINALKRLKGSSGNIFDNALRNLQFTGIKISSACTACGACERVCSCGALKIVRGKGGVFRILFYPENCVSCCLCRTVCHFGAIGFYSFSLSPDLEELEPIVLLAGELRTCQRCGAGFLPKNDNKRCPPCEFRLKNPFGSIHIP